MPATHKVVNGVEVPLSPEEAAAIEAEWVDNTPGTGVKWLADQEAKLQGERAAAKSVVASSNSDPQPLAKVLRAAKLVDLDEANRVRKRFRDQDAAVAAATSLADLKSRWATIAAAQPMSAVDIADVKTAIRNKIDAGDADA